jgi:hypothetical protein
MSHCELLPVTDTARALYSHCVGKKGLTCHVNIIMDVIANLYFRLKQLEASGDLDSPTVKTTIDLEVCAQVVTTCAPIHRQ